MNPIFILAITISTLVGYVIYRLMSHKNKPMALDKGGHAEGNTIIPDFKRNDLEQFFNECEENAISTKLAKEFIISIYNTLLWEFEPIAPKLNENRHEKWGIDDEIDDVLNYIFQKYNLEPVRWNDPEVSKLETFKDILLYLESKIEKIR